MAQVANNAMGGKATLQDMLVTSHSSKKEKTVDDVVSSRPSTQEVKFMFSGLTTK